MRGFIVGTGPSLTQEAIGLLKKTKYPLFGCNNTYQDLPLRGHLACNPEWWAHYWPIDQRLRLGRFDKWTWDWDTAQRYGIKYIKGEWGTSLSTTPGVIHYGHSSGYQLLNLATHPHIYGITEAVLIGYDLKYPKDYNGREGNPGGDRHYFGEYPPTLQHWTTQNMGPNNELNGLLDCYRTIDTKALGIRIINCSPGSALDFFEVGKLNEWV